MSKAFFSAYALMALLGVGVVIGVLYESKARGEERKNTQHIYTQSQLYQDSLFALSKVCLQKYDLQRCQEIHFSLGGYEARIEIKKLENNIAQIDILLEFLHPLNSSILRSNHRRYVSLDNL